MNTKKSGPKGNGWPLVAGGGLALAIGFAAVMWWSGSGSNDLAKPSTTIDFIETGDLATANGITSAGDDNAGEIRRLEKSLSAVGKNVAEISKFVGYSENSGSLHARLRLIDGGLATARDQNIVALGLALLGVMFRAWAAYRASTLTKRLAAQDVEIAKLRKQAPERDNDISMKFSSRSSELPSSAKRAGALTGRTPENLVFDQGFGRSTDGADTVDGPRQDPAFRHENQMNQSYAPTFSEDQSWQKAPSAPKPTPVAPPLPHARIAFEPIQELVRNGTAMISSEFRAKADGLGRRLAVDIGAGGLRVHPAGDDGLPRPLIAVVDEHDHGVLIPSHDYIKNFGIAHHKVRDTLTAAIEPFFEIAVTKEGSLRYDLPCEVVLDGSTVTVRQRGRLSGYSD